MSEISKRQRVVSVARHLLVSLCLSAGVLSVATIDSVFQEERHSGDLVKARIELSKKILRRLNREHKHELDQKSLAFHDSIAADEIGDTNPFLALSTLDPITSILERGIRSFSREVFRSPDYHAETGYDLVHYEIQLNDGTRADLMAYLERSSLVAQKAVGTPDERTPFVVVLSRSGESVNYSYYRAGDLIENTQIPALEADSLLTQRLSQGIPFLSVAR